MFGDSQQAQDNGGMVPPMDPGVMSAPVAQATEHQATPAYPTDDMNPVQQMHQAAVSSSMAQPADDTTSAANPAPDVAHNDEDLLVIKQDALQALSPLVSNLEQSPEEKFRTTMMMIQASDDKSLVRVAYEAAQAITDEKVKAQALLDVVNEINYFTSHQS